MDHSDTFQLGSYAVLFALLLVSGYTDITRNKVFNWCTFPGMGLGLALAYMAGGLLDTPGFNLVNSFAGLAVGGGIVLVFSLLGGIGLGDVKLMAAVGALAGFPLVLGALLYASLVGFVMAMGLLVWQGRISEGLRKSVLFAFRWKKPAEPAGTAPPPAEGARRPVDTIPFGAAIAFGTLIAFFLASR
jgi:prepilin peptidase CpaA